MEFNEKLQELRKQKGLTQEELAELLYVSRTAISKWESGRGFPNIESLKAISEYFSISLDDLLSGDKLLAIAEKDHKERETHFRDLLFGALDLSLALLFFLPFFGQRAGQEIAEVSLINLTEVRPYLRALYFTAVGGTVMFGILTLALQNCKKLFWIKSKVTVSLFFSIACTALFILSQQPYAAVLTFVFLVIKVLMLIKHR